MADNKDDATQAFEHAVTPDPLEAAVADALRSPPPPPNRPKLDVDELIEKIRHLARPKAVPLERVKYFGDYILLAEIGRGGMGVVYRARQVSLNRDVALKMVGTNFISPELLLRFRLEAEAAAALDHPHIVPVYEVGEFESQPYYCMKHIEGVDLGECKKQWQVPQAAPPDRLDRARQAAQLIEKLARAMHYAHQRGILHRDLKPTNVLMDTDQEPHITDFGLAKLLDAPSDMTATGAAVGTPSYMAPEQAAGSKTLTTAVDVYGLGAILYELLTGVPPFKGESSAQTLRLVLETEAKRPRALVPELEKDLESICLKAMAHDKNQRYASADEFANDLQRYLRNEVTVARQPQWHERLWKWTRRNRALAAFFATCGLALLVIIAILVSSNVLIARAQKETRFALEHQRHANYLKTVGMASRDLKDGDTSRALDLLSTCDTHRRNWEWYFLKRAAHDGYQRWTHSGEVCGDLEMSPNGTYLAALVAKTLEAPDPKLGRVWGDVQVVILDAGSGKSLHTLNEPTLTLDAPQAGWFPSLQISRESNFVAISCTHVEGGKFHGAVRCFDRTKDWQPVKLKTDLFRDQVVAGVFFDNKNLLYALTKPLNEQDRRDEIVEFQVINCHSGATKCTLKAKSRKTAPQLDRNASLLFIGGSGINAIDFATGEQLPDGELPSPGYSEALAISSDNKYLGCVSNSGRLLIYDFVTRTKLREIEAHVDGAYDLAFCSANRELVTVGQDGIMKRWRISDGEFLGKLMLGEALHTLAVNEKTGDAISASNLGALAVWSYQGSSALRRRDPRGNSTTTVQLEFSPDGKRIFVLQNKLTVWDAVSKAQIIELDFNQAKPDLALAPISVRPTHDGKSMAVLWASWDSPEPLGPIQVWSVDDGKLLTEFPKTKSNPISLIWDREEELVIASLLDRTVVALNAQTGAQTWALPIPFPYRVFSHPKTGEVFLVETPPTADRARVWVVNARNGTKLREFRIAMPGLAVGGFSFDGRLLVTMVLPTRENEFRNEIATVDSTTGEIMDYYQLSTQPELLEDAWLSKDETRLFLQTAKRDFRVYDHVNHELIMSLRNSDETFSRMALNADGLAVAVTTTGGGIYLWDGRPLEIDE